MYELHEAARDGSMERTVAVLSTGVVGIDESCVRGFTPLMIAAFFGHSRVVGILLDNGANATVGAENGLTALHGSAQGGHLAVTKLLLKAGADLEAKTADVGPADPGCTPLHLAAERGHLKVMRVLVEAGANLNSRKSNGSTPLYSAAHFGRVDAVKVLLRAKANPLLARSDPPGYSRVPLDVAAQRGHLEVVRELIQEHGIEGCGGTSGSVDGFRTGRWGPTVGNREDADQSRSGRYA